MSCNASCKRAQIRHDLFVKIARQKAKRFAGLHGGAGENNARNLAFAQRRQRHRHGQIGFARAGRADAEGHVVLADRIEVFLLADRFGGDAGFLVGRHDAVAHDVLERGDAFVFDDVERVRELAVAHGRAGLERIFEAAGTGACARSMASASPSSLIQPSREVALTPSWCSSACRLRGSLL